MRQKLSTVNQGGQASNLLIGALSPRVLKTMNAMTRKKMVRKMSVPRRYKMYRPKFRFGGERLDMKVVVHEKPVSRAIYPVATNNAAAEPRTSPNERGVPSSMN